MDKNDIILKEQENDGKSVSLFYDAMVGMYVAYGLSAYYVTMVISPSLSYSENLKMPVALLYKRQIRYLRQSMPTLEHQPKSYYRFQLRTKVGTAGYDRWLKETFGEQMVSP